MAKIDYCRVCRSDKTEQFFDLGLQPFANSLLNSRDEKENSYPLSLSWCSDCNLVQLDYTADPKELFSNYVWVTGTSETANKFANTFYEELNKRSSNISDSYVLEIASNDGAFLKPWKTAGYTILGIDPAENIAEMARKNGIPTKAIFWDNEAARDLVKENGQASIIFARNVLPHVANTRDFVEGLRTALKDNGLLAIEVHYAKIILEELHYDSIYHEHLCYFSLKSLENLLNSVGLFIFDLIQSPISGGSIIVYASQMKKAEAAIVKKYRDNELKNRTNELSSWREFADRASNHRSQLLQILNKAKIDGGLVAYGASARSSTMLNFCRIDYKLVSLVADRNTLKHNKFTPGSRIPIEPPEVVMKMNPRTVLLLAWNFTEEVINYLEKKFNYKGIYIIPLPNKPRIVKSSLS